MIKYRLLAFLSHNVVLQNQSAHCPDYRNYPHWARGRTQTYVEPPSCHFELMSGVFTCWDAKDLIQFFEGVSLSFREEEEDENP